jgi:oligosaccharide repeat unit polymerase
VSAASQGLLLLAWPVLLLAVVALLGRQLSRHVLAPAAFVPAYWTALLLVALLWNRSFPLQAAGLWLLSSMVVAFACGTWLVEYAARGWGGNAPPPVSRPLGGVGERRLELVIAALVAVAAAGVFGQVRAGVSTFGLAWTAMGLLQLGTEFSTLRYMGVDAVPRSVVFAQYVTFPAAALGGVLAASSLRRRARLVSILPLFAALAGGMVVAARAGILLAVVMWTGSFVAVKLRTTGGGYVISLRRWVPLGIAGAGALVGAYILLQYLRAGVEEEFTLFPLIRHAFASAIGSIAAFCAWVGSAPDISPALGAYSFAGPLDILGLVAREQGTYFVSVAFPSGDATNIYTVFRGLIEDFGIGGAWLVLAVCGALSQWAFREAERGRLLWVIGLALCYASVLFSPLYSMFIFNSVGVGWVVVAAVWWLVASPPTPAVARPAIAVTASE